MAAFHHCLQTQAVSFTDRLQKPAKTLPKIEWHTLETAQGTAVNGFEKCWLARTTPSTDLTCLESTLYSTLVADKLAPLGGNKSSNHYPCQVQQQKGLIIAENKNKPRQTLYLMLSSRLREQHFHCKTKRR
ncbi:hypothetical protein V2J09_009115 [Rumex salicifolius]